MAPPARRARTLLRGAAGAEGWRSLGAAAAGVGRAVRGPPAQGGLPGAKTGEALGWSLAPSLTSRPTDSAQNTEQLHFLSVSERQWRINF